MNNSPLTSCPDCGSTGSECDCLPWTPPTPTQTQNFLSSETQPRPVSTVEDALPLHTTTQTDYTEDSFLSFIDESKQLDTEKLSFAFNALSGRLKELEQTISLLSQRVDLVNNRVDFQQKTLDVAAESVGQLVDDMNQVKRRYERNKRKHQNQFPKISPSQG